jgi:uncharacterized protein YeaO (DUF488 family)
LASKGCTTRRAKMMAHGPGRPHLPRNIPMAEKRVDERFKGVAPTAELREQSREGGDFSDSTEEYRKELEERAKSRKAFDGPLQLARPGTPTPVHTGKNQERDHAVAPKDASEERIWLLPAPGIHPENALARGPPYP